MSDTRGPGEDRSGDLALERITAAGHRMARRAIVPDEPEEVRRQVFQWLGDGSIQVVLVCGGTGVSRRDRSYEALDGLFEQRLDGFGELFRVLSYDDIGARSMLSRATAGIARGKPLFLIPGSSAAVELALAKLILPQIPHLLAELAR